MLIDFGADINSIYRLPGNVVQTPLDCSLNKGHRSTAKFLQLHGGLPANKLRLSGKIQLFFSFVSMVSPFDYIYAYSHFSHSAPLKAILSQFFYLFYDLVRIILLLHVRTQSKCIK